MTCTVHHIRGGPQTGKTTMALGFLERLERTGRPTHGVVPRGLYVAYSQHNAQHWRGLTSVICVGLNNLTASEAAGRTAVVVDDCDCMDPQHIERVVWAWNQLRTYSFPTQLVLVNWPGEFPPKEIP